MRAVGIVSRNQLYMKTAYSPLSVVIFTLRLLFLSEEFAEECLQLLRPLLVDGGTTIAGLQSLHLFTQCLVLHGVLGDGGVVLQLVL